MIWKGRKKKNKNENIRWYLWKNGTTEMGSRSLW